MSALKTPTICVCVCVDGDGWLEHDIILPRGGGGGGGRLSNVVRLDQSVQSSDQKHFCHHSLKNKIKTLQRRDTEGTCSKRYGNSFKIVINYYLDENFKRQLNFKAMCPKKRVLSDLITGNNV